MQGSRPLKDLWRERENYRHHFEQWDRTSTTGTTGQSHLALRQDFLTLLLSPAAVFDTWCFQLTILWNVVVEGPNKDMQGIGTNVAALQWLDLYFLIGLALQSETKSMYLWSFSRFLDTNTFSEVGSCVQWSTCQLNKPMPAQPMRRCIANDWDRRKVHYK